MNGNTAVESPGAYLERFHLIICVCVRRSAVSSGVENENFASES